MKICFVSTDAFFLPKRKAGSNIDCVDQYGVKSQGSGDYDVDHLIPLELGGSNSIKNLWPEPNRTSPWSAKVKDQLERKLHKLVCSGQLDLKTAQQAIAADWIGAYKFYVSPIRQTR